MRQPETTLKTQVAPPLNEFERLAGYKAEIVKREFVNGMEHRLKEENPTIEELVIEPLAAICPELPEEFTANMRRRKNF